MHHTWRETKAQLRHTYIARLTQGKERHTSRVMQHKETQKFT